MKGERRRRQTENLLLRDVSIINLCITLAIASLHELMQNKCGFKATNKLKLSNDEPNQSVCVCHNHKKPSMENVFNKFENVTINYKQKRKETEVEAKIAKV